MAWRGIFGFWLYDKYQADKDSIDSNHKINSGYEFTFLDWSKLFQFWYYPLHGAIEPSSLDFSHLDRLDSWNAFLKLKMQPFRHQHDKKNQPMDERDQTSQIHYFGD